MTGADSPTADDDGGLRERLREQRRGMFIDLVFAVVWVTLASVLVALLDGPQWALYLLLAAGIPGYFVFFYSLRIARTREQKTAD